MAKKSLVDDVHVRYPKVRGLGPAVLFTNQEIRRMLRLVKASKNDVFFDLGSGWAQNLIIAATEFRVGKCVGIEDLRTRHQKAKSRVDRWSVSDRVQLINGTFEDAMQGKFDNCDFSEATIVLYALSTSPGILNQLSKSLSRGCKLVYYYNTLFPEIMPDRSDYPFYYSQAPFRTPKYEVEWLDAIIQKKTSSVDHWKPPTVAELWDELSHDYDQLGIRSDVNHYRERLRKIL